MSGRLFDGRSLDAEIIDISENNDNSVNMNALGDNSDAKAEVISKPPIVTVAAASIVKKPNIISSTSQIGNRDNTNLAETGVDVDVNKIEEDTDNFLNSLL